jgi:very-short-patch-repair endonuclease
MIDFLGTFEKYGYYPESLSYASHKNIQLVCDYCGKTCNKSYKSYNSQRNTIEKDCCANSACRYKKREEISLKKYGVKNSAQRQEVRDKIRDLNTDRLRSEEFKQQSKKTNKDKYGSENPMLVPSIIDKQKQTLINKYGTYNIMKYADTAKKAAQKMKKTKIDRGLITIYDEKTRPELAKEVGFSRSHFGKLVVKYGIDKALTFEKEETSLEKFLSESLKELNIIFNTQFKIANKITDFKIGNLCIEADGLYWHSDGAKVDYDYHVKKREIYIKYGYEALFFREDEIKNKLPIVQSIILNKLNRSNKIFARKCFLSILNNKESDLFFETNHLMGKGKGKTYCLKYKDETVAAIRVKRLKNKEYEISRFCNILNTSVTGGFSKLLKAAINELKPESIITFIDLRYGKGEYLEKIGFKYIHTYPSFRWTDGKESWHRLKFPGNSGYKHNLFKIWDCGQAKYLLKP